jgi:hypothetical protein
LADKQEGISMKKLLAALLVLSFAGLPCQAAFVSRAWAAESEYSAEFSAYSGSVSPYADGYAISLTLSGTSVLQVTVTNTGAQTTGSMSVALSGTDAGSFNLSKTSIGSLAPGGSDSFTIETRSGLGTGTYYATVTVGNSNVNASENFYATISVSDGSESSGCEVLGGMPVLAAFLMGLALLRTGKNETRRKG